MAKTKKRTLLSVLAIAAATVLMVASIGALTACGGSSDVYTVDGIANLNTAADFEFIHFSAYGDDHGIGMVNINDWGNKKLKSNGRSVSGEGAIWGVELDVADETTYALSVYCDMIGAGDVYDGECRMTYLFNGTYTNEEGSKEFVLSAPTYCSVTFTTDTYWNYLPEEYDFADYLPGCNDKYQPDENGVFFFCDSTGTIEDSLTSPNGVPNEDFRFTPEHLLDSVFGGATFVTKGKKIDSVKDAKAPTFVGYIR